MRYAIGLSAIGVGILLVFAGFRDESALAIFVNAMGGDMDTKPHLATGGTTAPANPSSNLNIPLQDTGTLTA